MANSLRRSVPQINPSLDTPLNVDAPPSIYASSLTPELATAALNLPVEFLKQKQGLANKRLISHPVVMATIGIFLSTYLATQLTIPKNTSSSFAGYLYQIFLMNKKEVITALLFTLIAASFLFTLLSRVSDLYFRTQIDHIVKTKGEEIYGVNLNDVGVLTTEELKNKPKSFKDTLENTHIIVYRETPIALISMAKNNILSTADSLIMSISAVGSRRVYIKSGIIEDLFDWAMVRTRAISSSGNYGKSMKILTEVYSFDSEMKKILRSKGFVKVQSARVNENRILGGLFGIRKELWGVQFHYEKRD
ncbi:Inorganic phosphate transporter PHO86 [Nakaseomyces bracarensis]|uniref:Inorganic phosphate transporter PHO86 n=1 Tax=Nakaseomyces bracarensis TaxID=273131 RepID=A0ABR4NRE6_9SACH